MGSAAIHPARSPYSSPIGCRSFDRLKGSRTDARCDQICRRTGRKALSVPAPHAFVVRVEAMVRSGYRIMLRRLRERQIPAGPLHYHRSLEESAEGGGGGGERVVYLHVLVPLRPSR